MTGRDSEIIFKKTVERSAEVNADKSDGEYKKIFILTMYQAFIVIV